MISGFISALMVEQQLATAKVVFMEDQTLNSEEEEVATQETDVNETEAQPEETQETVDERALEQERNWKAMRQRQKELEMKLEQKDQMLNEFIKAQQQRSVPQPQEEAFDPTDYSTYAGVEKVAGKKLQPLEQKIADLEAKLAQQEQTKLVNSLKSQFPDFDDVVNVETLELFEKTEPELAKTINTADPYKFALQAYKLIKAYGITDQLPGARRKKEINQKLEQNKKTVQTPQAYDKRPMAQAYRISQAEEKRLVEEMLHCASKCTGF